ncbi:flagellar hook-basal body complex protein [Loktanella sp. S4079]|uniref:flagellar hook-basal body complex protein n=1 Tax=Loktanella sp. S4079 TaxID=579483 RepID=UPI0005FA9126|nr:flagellar hook-basal body complex protein [Loktanella sp. S4079]KJZ21149.1 flagellar basal body rod protein FlgF [Loktanella sp. S4079]
MDNASYATLTRQAGLMTEMQVIANNIANASTTGFRSEEVMFSEHVKALSADADSLSMATANVRDTVQTQGSLTQTGGTFDLAIEGEGFFVVETPNGQRLTRAGAFGPNENGDLVTPDGHPVLDAGGAPIFVPQGAGTIGIGADGTISVGAQPVGQIGIVLPTDPNQMTRETGVLFNAQGGFEPAPNGRMVQGFLEESNVNPITQISRMIEVQRAYEMGQGFLDNEHERIRGVIKSIR